MQEALRRILEAVFEPMFYDEMMGFRPNRGCHKAIRKLNLMLERSSNLTYRLYDYDRIGKDGKKRELHIDKALDVADLYGSAEPRQPLRILKYRPGMASELLIRCKYFEVYRMLINTERRQTVHYRADRMAFRVLLCVDGCGTISYDEGTVNFYKGDCVFVPADSEVLTIHGQAQFLDIRG